MRTSCHPCTRHCCRSGRWASHPRRRTTRRLHSTHCRSRRRSCNSGRSSSDRKNGPLRHPPTRRPVRRLLPRDRRLHPRFHRRCPGHGHPGRPRRRRFREHRRSRPRFRSGRHLRLCPRRLRPRSWHLPFRLRLPPHHWRRPRRLRCLRNRPRRVRRGPHCRRTSSHSRSWRGSLRPQSKGMASYAGRLTLIDSISRVVQWRGSPGAVSPRAGLQLLLGGPRSRGSESGWRRPTCSGSRKDRRSCRRR
jgi:hypothetical protein